MKEQKQSDLTGAGEVEEEHRHQGLTGDCWEVWLLSHDSGRVVCAFSLETREESCTLNERYGILSGCGYEES